MDKRVYILTTITFIVGLVELIIGGILPLIANDLDITLGRAGLLITVFSLSFAISGPILLSLTAKIKRKKLIIIVLVLFLLSNVLAVVSTSFTPLLISRILSAMFAALLISLCLSIASQITSTTHRSRAIGIVLTGVSASLVFGVPFGLFLGNEWGWRAPFLMIVFILMILIVLMWLFMSEIEGKEALPLKAQINALSNPKIIMTQSISILFYVGHLSLYAYLTPFLQTTMNLTGDSLTIMYLILGVAAIFGSWSGGYASDRFGTKKTIIVVLSLFATMLFMIFVLLSKPVMLVIALMLWSFLSWALTPAIQSQLVSIAPETSDIQQSINNSNIHIGMAIGSFIGGINIDLYKVEFNSIIGGVIAVFALILAIVALNYQRYEANQSDGLLKY
ncbi:MULTISPECIES: MFS transporter [Allobacillus]|uniref:MFS transporter n=1 Tax=Allobacillus halotolerans TaxID=570278 RepID=A0ABS6GNU5_9BACI|nr:MULTISPECIES: MFS transporter [Allobacillus]MBU6080330.1 MFS transporter [Allobacillus halotolerans]TSJ65122.1 MFS transporter [Allobacillus sp. SKP2-8]